jgi:hypothetical protein
MEYTTQDGFVWEVISKGEAMNLFKNNKEVFKLYDDDSEAAIEDELDFIDEFVMYAIVGKQSPRKWARIDTATGKGMNEGFCVNDGDAYFENETDLIKYLREQNVDGNKELSDDFILAEAYQLEEYYYTEWDVEDSDYYYEEQADGTLIEINL